MKKKLLNILTTCLLTALAVGLLSACGNSSSASAAAEEEPVLTEEAWDEETEDLPAEEAEQPDTSPDVVFDLALADFEDFAGLSREELKARFGSAISEAKSDVTFGNVSYLGYPGSLKFFFDGDFMNCASWTADEGSEAVYEEVLSSLRAAGKDGAYEVLSSNKHEQTVNVDGRDLVAGYDESEDGTWAYLFTRYTLSPYDAFWTDAQVPSEGLAWVTYGNDGTTSVIDTAGTVRFMLNTTPGYMSPFHEGTAVYTIAGTETDVLIDSDGHEIYRTEGGEDQNVKRERIVGYANGVYLLVREESGITDASVKAALMAPDGRFLTDYTDAFEVKTGYGGRGCSLSSFLNEKDLSWRGSGWYEAGGFMISFDRMLLTNMSTLQIVADFTDNDELVTRDHMNYLARYDRDMNYIASTDVGGYPAEMKDGRFFWDWDETGYYNAKVERVIAVDAYPDNRTYGTPFDDGTALFEIEGADGKKYLTMIDESGRVLFEPVVVKDYYPRALGGYAIIKDGNEELWIMDKAGQAVHSLSADFPGCDVDLATRYGWSEPSAAELSALYGEGWLLITYRHDGGSYKRLYPVAEAAEAGENVYDLGTLYPAPAAEEAAEAEETAEADASVEKDYAEVKGLTIEGKWKSIGSYGFGQAQPGAIVVFDGTHCNVFSPSDTYVFYEEGDHYILEATSFLSTGTESFTVRATDEDHVDLIQGSYVTELERME